MNQNYFHSVVLNPKRCIGCTSCLKVCPTEAIRLKEGKASIIPERCIDCGECIRICPNHAKNAVTDSLDILKNYRYTIALTTPILYGQFGHDISPASILSSLTDLGFDEAVDTSIGSKIINTICKSVIKQYKTKPVINSSCPAITRLIQVRFPELLDNILNIETPVEIAARISKQNAAGKNGLSIDDIGIILITPCTARVTSIKSPIGIPYSYIDGAISIEDIYGPLLKALSSRKSNFLRNMEYDHSGITLDTTNDRNILIVNGIDNAISVLEEIEMGKLNNLPFIDISACPNGCLGGPLVFENRYVALNNLRQIFKEAKDFEPSNDDKNEWMDMYKNGFIRLTEEIKPRMVMTLDPDIRKSIIKMETIKRIERDLPGINCGICGSPTCHAFAEDIVTGNRSDALCPVSMMNMMEKPKTISKD